MEAELLIKLSIFVDKLGIDLTSIKGKDNEEVGTILLSQVLKNLAKAENEFYDLLANYKGVSVEEAKKIDIIQLFKELKDTEGLKSFFVKS